MCIATTVGRGGRNDLADVAVVQVLLNLNRRRFPPPLRLTGFSQCLLHHCGT